MTTIAEALDSAARALRAAGVEPARREARLLVELAAGVDAGTILGRPERPLAPEDGVRLGALLRRRCAGEPVSRLAGVREFWSLPFQLSCDTLDPRPDSETIVEAALAAVPDRQAPLRLLDLGTGTGCLLLALLSELPDAFGIGLDASEGACRTARNNALQLGLGGRAMFLVADWAAPVVGRFDLIVSNPPYIPEGEIMRLAREVAGFDPHRALAGGVDGLDAYRSLAPQFGSLLSAGGTAVLEVGAGQAEAVSDLLGNSGLQVAGHRRDLGGIVRAVIAENPMETGAAPKKGFSSGVRPTRF